MLELEVEVVVAVISALGTCAFTSLAFGLDDVVVVLGVTTHDSFSVYSQPKRKNGLIWCEYPVLEPPGRKSRKFCPPNMSLLSICDLQRP